jgi:hypothetical protein
MNQTDGFFSDWTKKNYMTTNQASQTQMLSKMHPQLFDKFGNKIHLNQKFHPAMTGKVLNGSHSMTPNNYSKKGEVFLLQGPIQPKARAFFEQAYQGKPDFKRQTMSQTRPYTAYQANDDAMSYMSHQKLKQQKDKHQRTLDPRKLVSRKKGRKQKAKQEEEEEWERFNEQVR